MKDPTTLTRSCILVRLNPPLRHRLHDERVAQGPLREELPARIQRGLPQVPGITYQVFLIGIFHML